MRKTDYDNICVGFVRKEWGPRRQSLWGYASLRDENFLYASAMISLWRAVRSGDDLLITLRKKLLTKVAIPYTWSRFTAVNLSRCGSKQIVGCFAYSIRKLSSATTICRDITVIKHQNNSVENTYICNDKWQASCANACKWCPHSDSLVFHKMQVEHT